MNTHTTSLPPQPPFGRRLVEQARIHNVSPQTFIRAIRKPKKLLDGRLVSLAATVTRGTYLIRDEDIAAYYEALTADRLGRPTQPAPRSPAQARRDHEAADDVLQAAGFGPPRTRAQ